MKAYCLGLALFAALPNWAAAAHTGTEEQLNLLRQNINNAFLWSYLHHYPGKLHPAPAKIRRIGVALTKGAQASLRYHWHFYTIDIPDVNATATPTGNVFIQKGVLDLGLTDQELAALMAHELAHVVKEHQIKILIRQIQAAILTAYTQKVYGKEDARLERLHSFLDQLRFHREEEQEADFVGMNILRDSGYPPQAMVTMLKKLQIRLASSPANKLPPYLSTHPPFPERIELAENVAAYLSSVHKKKQLRRVSF